jgi:hypothetical protein
MLLDAIERLEKSAYEKAGINQTMISGYRQAGTTSAEQVEALQESPLVKIRRQQRNFKNYKIARAEKILMFVMQNYTDQRFISLSTGIDGAKMARISTDPTTKQKTIALLQEVEGVVKEIKSIAFNDKWRFKIQCTAGTGIPRTRKEMAQLTDEIAANPIMQSGDLDLIEMYLTAKDYPQRRALMTLLRNKQTQAQMPVNKVAAMQASLRTPDNARAFADVMKALTGFAAGQQAYLRSYGFIGQTDTLMDAPIQTITSKSPVKDIAAVAPGQISREPAQVKFGNEEANRIEDTKNKKPFEVIQ